MVTLEDRYIQLTQIIVCLKNSAHIMTKFITLCFLIFFFLGCEEETRVREPYKSELAKYEWAIAKYNFAYQTDLCPAIIGQRNGQFYLQKLYIDYVEKGYPWKSTTYEIQVEEKDFKELLDIKNIPLQDEICDFTETIRDAEGITLIQYDDHQYYKVSFRNINEFINECDDNHYFRKVSRIDSLISLLEKKYGSKLNGKPDIR